VVELLLFFVGRNKIELYRAVVELQKNILGGIKNDKTRN
jgi:hypothetical protein